jgi:urease accessory protein
MPAATATRPTRGTITTTESGLYRLLAWLSPAFPVGAFSYSHGLEAAVEAGAVRDRATLERWLASVLLHGSGRIDADLFRDAWRIVAPLAATPRPLPLAPSDRPLPLAGEGWGEGPGQLATTPTADGAAAPALTPPSPASGTGQSKHERETLSELLALCARADAHRGTAELALESRAQGEAFLLICRAAWPHPFLDDWAVSLDAAERKPAYAVAVAGAAALAGVPLEASLTAYLHAVAANLVSAGVRLVPLGQTDGQRCLAALEPVVETALRASLQRDPEDFGAATLAVDLLSMAHETQYTRLFRS